MVCMVGMCYNTMNSPQKREKLKPHVISFFGGYFPPFNFFDGGGEAFFVLSLKYQKDKVSPSPPFLKPDPL